MAKDTVHIENGEKVVREDTARGFRAVNWMIASIVGFVIIVAVFAAFFFLGAARDGEIGTPANVSDGGRK